jgi:aerobic carbon-monoxide dehydrogenase large subunit
VTDLLSLPAKPSYIGRQITRLEDDRLLSGGGEYVADLARPGMLEMVVIRSPSAHALVKNVDLNQVRNAEGVLAAVTAADLGDISPFPEFIPYVKQVNWLPLAKDRVRYVGAPVAAIVAENRYVGEDAAEYVDLELEELPSVVSIDAALAGDAPRLYEDWPDNKLLDFPASNPAVDEELRRSRRVHGRYTIRRHTGMPIETRGCIAEFRDGRLTLWTTNQHPHIARTTLAHVLPLRERDIRVVAPDVGGGFGPKQGIYPEDVIASRLAMMLRRPIRYIEDRHEHMTATSHARDQVIDIEGAIDDEGYISALRVQILNDLGSGETYPPGFCPSLVTAGHMTGPYRIPLAEVSVTAVVTNKTPSAAYRGYGVPEAVFALERFVEKASAEVGLDPLEVRRRMLIDKRDLPYVTAGGGLVDSGSFHEAFELGVDLGRSTLRAAQASGPPDGHSRFGLGIATYREGTAASHFGVSGNWTGQEACTMRLDPDGTVVVSTGMTDQGQGMWTMVATLAADALGVPIEDVRVVGGDTDLCPYGLGAWASRQTVVGGGAILKAAEQMRRKMLRIAGHLMEADPEDLVIEAGTIHVQGSEEPKIDVRDVGLVANVRTGELPPGVDPGVTVTSTYEPPGLEHVPHEDGKINAAVAWANATHAAVVRVDLETGEIHLLDYHVVHDCGRILNPPIVDGQIVGGAAQGIGGALYEDLPYTPDGQPLATTFMDYLVPTAEDIPHMTVRHFESPSPSLPLGLKGVGEGGTCGALGAIANAVSDALSDFGVDITGTPMTPRAIRDILRDSEGLPRTPVG